MYKRCSRCGARIPSGLKCPHCKREDSNRRDGVRKEYHTSRWKRLREATLAAYSYVDLYALYREGRIVPADRVHHIEEALDHPEAFYDPGNLFPLSDASHHEVHRRYKDEGEALVRRELRSYLRRWKTEPKKPQIG